MTMQFRPIRVECGDQIFTLRPYESLDDLAYLTNAGIKKSECVRLESLSPYKISDLLGLNVPQTFSALVGRGQVDWDKSLTAPRQILDLELVPVGWETAIEPGDRLVFKTAEDIKPSWNADSRTLSFGGAVVKTFRNSQARNQMMLLSGFEELGWPKIFYEPFPGSDVDAPKRLADAVSELNRNHKTPGLISFHTSKGGTAVVWRSMLEGN